MLIFWLLTLFHVSIGMKANSVISSSNSNLTVQVVHVTGYEPFDYRGIPVYVVTFSYFDSSTGVSLNGTVHRQYAEFQQLEDLFEPYWWDSAPSLPLDSSGVDGMNGYLQNVSTTSLTQSSEFLDFLGINGAFCQGLQWFKSLEDLMYIQYVVTLPNFIPEPPYITQENLLETPESLFECYIVLVAYKKGLTNLPFVVGLIENYTAMMPAFDNGTDNELWPPGVNSSIDIPQPWLNCPVHFQPGGYNNGRNIRISWLSKNKYNFLHEDLIRIWLLKLYGNAAPKRILDVGSGYGFSTFVFGELFPEAQVIGVDLSSANVRFTRQWKELRGADNVEFYLTNGQDTIFDAESFDIVHFTYVLHEMVANDSMAILQEAYRLLKPNGSISGFEVPFIDDIVQREFYVEFNTWGPMGEEDFKEYGFHGPEPFMDEYENYLQLPYALEQVGFLNTTVYPYSEFDFIISASKP